MQLNVQCMVIWGPGSSSAGWIVKIVLLFWCVSPPPPSACTFSAGHTTGWNVNSAAHRAPCAIPLNMSLPGTPVPLLAGPAHSHCPMPGAWPLKMSLVWWVRLGRQGRVPCTPAPHSSLPGGVLQRPPTPQGSWLALQVAVRQKPWPSGCRWMCELQKLLSHLLSALRLHVGLGLTVLRSPAWEKLGLHHPHPHVVPA